MYTSETTQYPERIPNFEPFRVEGVLETQLLKRVLDYLETFYPARFQYITETPIIPNEQVISVATVFIQWVNEIIHQQLVKNKPIGVMLAITQ